MVPSVRQAWPSTETCTRASALTVGLVTPLSPPGGAGYVVSGLRTTTTLPRVLAPPRSTVTVAEGSSPIHWVVTVPSSAASAGSAVAGAAVAGRQRARAPGGFPAGRAGGRQRARSPVGFRSGRRVGRRSVDRRTSLPDGVVSRTGSPDLSVTRVLL